MSPLASSVKIIFNILCGNLNFPQTQDTTCKSALTMWKLRQCGSFVCLPHLLLRTLRQSGTQNSFRSFPGMLFHFPELSLSHAVFSLPVIHKRLQLILPWSQVSQFLIKMCLQLNKCFERPYIIIFIYIVFYDQDPGLPSKLES